MLIASVFAAGRVPWAGALLFGAIADRRDARTVLVGLDLGPAFVLAIMAAYFIFENGLRRINSGKFVRLKTCGDLATLNACCPMFTMGLCYIACVGTRNPTIVFIAMFFQQAFTMIGVVASLSMRQRAIPSALQGRVSGISRAFTGGSQVFGSLVGGWIIQRSGTDAMFLITGMLILVGALSIARPLRTAMIT